MLRRSKAAGPLFCLIQRVLLRAHGVPGHCPRLFLSDKFVCDHVNPVPALMRDGKPVAGIVADA